jgi:hypothetical protein
MLKTGKPPADSDVAVQNYHDLTRRCGLSSANDAGLFAAPARQPIQRVFSKGSETVDVSRVPFFPR